jgi:hypothetical protein
MCVCRSEDLCFSVRNHSTVVVSNLRMKYILEHVRYWTTLRSLHSSVVPTTGKMVHEVSNDNIRAWWVPDSDFHMKHKRALDLLPHNFLPWLCLFWSPWSKIELWNKTIMTLSSCQTLHKRNDINDYSFWRLLPRMEGSIKHDRLRISKKILIVS